MKSLHGCIGINRFSTPAQNCMVLPVPPIDMRKKVTSIGNNNKIV